MDEHGHDWITLHRVRFAAPIAAPDRSFPPVAGASVWRFCPQHVPGPDGLTTLTSEIWGGLGIWDDRAEAEALLSDPDRCRNFGVAGAERVRRCFTAKQMLDAHFTHYAVVAGRE